jgi:predicted flap endonuclease-1-like 5' DNA nuclease
VELEPGRFVKMHREHARARGLLPDQQKKKRRKLARDKRLRPVDDKRQRTNEQKAAQADDLTEIPGVGPATAQKLRERGLGTFEALRSADLGAFDTRTRQAIEDWRGR